MTKTPEELAEEWLYSECNHRQFDTIAQHEKAAAIAEKAYLAGYAAAAPKWIPVTDDTLPHKDFETEVDKSLLVLGFHHDRQYGQTVEVFSYTWVDNSDVGMPPYAHFYNFQDDTQPEYWMPLPGVPKEIVK